MKEDRSEAAAIQQEFVAKFPDYDIESFFQSSRWAQAPERAAIVREGLRKAGVIGT
jgi:hypothetical protein